MSDGSNNVSTTNTTLVINGQEEVFALPDIAVVTLGVQTIGNQMSSIENENSRTSTVMLKALQQLGDLDIKNKEYSINKVYDYDNGIRLDKGYIIRNIYELTIHDLSLVGTAIDTAVNSGANIVDLVSFQLSNPDQIYKQALNQAVIDAFTKAKSIYTLLGHNEDPISVRIIENSTAPITTPINVNPKSGTNITPVESGKTQISASVTVEFI
jgi:uncharacterized protein YggE